MNDTLHQAGDDIQFRAVRDAALHAPAPLNRLQGFIVACVAVARAAPTLDPGASQTERYAHLLQTARAALEFAATGADAMRARLVGGIEDLPHHQQLAVSLRFEHGLSNTEIGAVMGMTTPEVRACFALAFDSLWGGL